MSFGHRIYACMVALFAVLLTAALALISIRAQNQAISGEMRRAEREHYAISAALSMARGEKELLSQFAALRDTYADMDSELRLMKYPSGARQGALIPGGDGADIIRVAGPLGAPYSDRTLIYARDISPLRAQSRENAIRLALIGAGMLAACALLTAAALSGLTSPIRRLSRAIGAFSQSHGARLSRSAGCDEIAAIHNQFVAMADETRRYERQISDESARRQMFIDDLAHELRTPATAVSGYAQLLRGARLNQAQRDTALDHISAESARMLALYEKLMLLTGIRHGAIEPRRIGAREFADYICAAAEPICAEYECRLKCDIKCREITGDRELLTQLAINLIQNSAHALAGGERDIILSIAPTEDGARLCVADRGRGMDAETARRATDPFYRADRARSRSQGGVGLGLSICRAIAEAHGARLVIESQPGAGTRVMVDLSDDADMMQLGAYPDAGDMVSSPQSGRKARTESEGNIMRRHTGDTIAAVALTLAACAAILFGVPGLSAVRSYSAPEVTAQPAQEERIPLSIPAGHDARFDSVKTSRELSARELEMVNRLDPAGDSFDWSGITAPGEEPNASGIWYEFEGGGVLIHLPENELSWEQAAALSLLARDIQAYAGYDGARLFDESGRRIALTERERARRRQLEDEYSAGARPGAPAPTEPGADGFYYDSEADTLYYPNAYELTREQLLQVISIERARCPERYALLDRIIGPIKDYSNEELAALAEGIMRRYGFEPDSAPVDWEYRAGYDMMDRAYIRLTGYPEGADSRDESYAWGITYYPDADWAAAVTAPLNRAGAPDIGKEFSALYNPREATDELLRDARWAGIAGEYLAKYVPGFEPEACDMRAFAADHTQPGTGKPAAAYVEVLACSASPGREAEEYHVLINPETGEIAGLIAIR